VPTVSEQTAQCERQDDGQRRGARLGPAALLVDMMNRRDLDHEAVVITISYAFLFAGAWNDELLGFQPSIWSHLAETFMALVLAAEVAVRIAMTRKRSARFYALAALDMFSIATVVPGLAWASFARLARMLYAAMRLTLLLDRLAADRKNAMYITALFPLVVPVLAGAVFAIERRVPGTPIHTYVDALRICFSFSLSLGNVRPVTDGAMAICGALFLLGIVTIGLFTNAVSDRYQDP
jgi:ABC-type proline/glycine betaine transport system permease subunit